MTYTIVFAVWLAGPDDMPEVEAIRTPHIEIPVRVVGAKNRYEAYNFAVPLLRLQYPIEQGWILAGKDIEPHVG